MKNKTFRFITALITFGAVLLSGCAGRQMKENAGAGGETAVIQNIEQGSKDEDKGPFYLLTQNVILKPDASMLPEDLSPSDGIYVVANRQNPMGDYAYTFWDRAVVGKTLCEMYRLYGAGVDPADYGKYQELSDPSTLRHLVGFLIRVVDEENGVEKAFCIKDEDFSIDDKNITLAIDGLVGMYLDKLYIRLFGYVYSEKDNCSYGSGIYIACTDMEGNSEVLAEIPDDYAGCEFFLDEGKLCILNYNGSNLVCYDENYENPKNYVMSPRAQGYFITEDGNAYYYGVKSSELWIKDEADSEPVYTIGSPYKLEDYTDYAIAINGDVVFAADSQGAYRLENGEVTHISFTDQDFYLDGVNGAFPRQDGGFGIFGICDGDYSVFDATPCESNPVYLKKNIKLLSNFYQDDLKKVVSRYNRGSKNCRIIILEPDISEGYENMLSNLSMEMAMGNGPDIFYSGYYDCVSLAAKEGIVPLDDLIKDAGEEYILPVFESCKIGGTLYSVPVTSMINSVVTSEEFAQGKSLSLPDFIKAVEETGAEKAIDLSKREIVYRLGVNTPEDGGFIDWKERKSNFDSKEFIDLLNFAYKYGFEEDEQYSQEVNGDIYEGKIPCMMGNNITLEKTNRYYGFFKGAPAYIGMPSNSGNSALISGSLSFCVNSSSEYIEEAKDFLKWIISKEGQQAIYDAQYVKNHGEFFDLPLRWDILDEQIEAHNYYNSGGILTFENPDGTFVSFEVGPMTSGSVSWKPRALTDEDVDMIKSMLKNACPTYVENQSICDIVDEELGGFLAGQKTAEETARVINSRVQLYLDESS